MIKASRRRGSEIVRERFQDLMRSRWSSINETVRLELLVGVKDRTEFERGDEFLKGLRQLPLVRETWDLCAGLGFDLRRRGVVVALPDLIIAASAIEHDAVLVHADSDFDRIAEHTTLKVESHADAI